MNGKKGAGEGDPGHAARLVVARGFYGTREVDISLALAKNLRVIEVGPVVFDLKKHRERVSSRLLLYMVY